jgi:hypothetical protein
MDLGNWKKKKTLCKYLYIWKVVWFCAPEGYGSLGCLVVFPFLSYCPSWKSRSRFCLTSLFGCCSLRQLLWALVESASRSNSPTQDQNELQKHPLWLLSNKALHFAWISILALPDRSLHWDAGLFAFSSVTSAAYSAIVPLFICLWVEWRLGLNLISLYLRIS